ncbi:MAG: sigma-54 dependent transcriptional regulator [Verrucomicrobiota bacterium]
MPTPDSSAGRLLIADDQDDVLQALHLLLKGEGYRTRLVSSPRKALAALEAEEFDAALIDLNYARDTTSGQEGLDLLARIQALDATLPVVVMTAWATVDLAVEAMRRGARDFIQKPWDDARVLAILRTQVELARALRKGRRLEAENAALRAEGLPNLIAASPAMRPVLELVNRVARSDANVLLTGESGTGKNVIARTLHALSDRAAGPFIAVNMGGLTDTLFESELFGHTKGAFTDARADRIGRFETADGGTLFLDEIANVPLKQQAKLLHVVETGEFERLGSSQTRRASVRILSATNADIRAETAAARFRSDLLFRLNTVEIHLPPLRERREDIPALAADFLQRFAQRYRKPVSAFEPAALQLLVEHAWPGNVRELGHAIERAVLLAQGNAIKPADLGLRSTPTGAALLEEMSLEEVERWLIKKTLARCDGNANAAAEALGLSRSAFYRRIAKHGL